MDNSWGKVIYEFPLYTLIIEDEVSFLLVSRYFYHYKSIGLN